MTDQSDATVRRGPGRPPNPVPAAQPVAQQPKAAVKATPPSTNITYVPQPGDPASTVWNGYTFHANKPTAVPNHEEKMLSQAKTNPWFNVEGHDPAAPAADDSHPTDSDGYRRYAVAWFKANDWYRGRPTPDAAVGPNSKEFEKRWESEEALRASVGVGTDDIEYLNKLYVPRLAELKKAES